MVLKYKQLMDRKLFMVPWSASVVTLWHSMNWQGLSRVLALPTVNADTVSVLLRTCSHTSMRMHLLKEP